jgi:hypothetical protein
MEPDRRRQLLLAVLAVALAVGAYSLWPRSGIAVSPRSAARTEGREDAAGGLRATPDVHLEALRDPRPEPGGVERNLFRFRSNSGAAPIAPPAAASRPGPAAAPPAPQPPPPLPPIPLKFIGIVEAATQGRRLAILTDGLGPPAHGGEGDIVLGRYRILKIGSESIELTYLDGRGRQTIRLSGT